MQCYDGVEVVAIQNNRFYGTLIRYQRHPHVGDRGAILEVYTIPVPGFEVECSDSQGNTIWLEAMYPDELIVIRAHEPHSV
jgi:hypothetical protein